MFHKLPIPLKIFILYILSAILAYLARLDFTQFGISANHPVLEFLWIAYLPVATAASLLTFDLIIEAVDFEEIDKLKEENKVVYVVAICILSAGFAVASAVFLR